MLFRNFLLEKIQNQQPVLGTWSIYSSSSLTETLSLTGLDFIVIDREHGPVSHESALTMVMACERHQVSPVMRVSELSLSEVQRALDLGVHGIHVPNVETVEQVKALIEYAKYPPVGNRGFSPFTRASKYQAAFAKTQQKTANEKTLLCVHLEGKKAIDNLDRFLQFPELDIIFLGLYDLSKSLGIPGDVQHPDVLRYLTKSTEKIRASGKIPGTIASTEEQIQQYLNYGVQYLTFSVDCDVISQSYSKAVKAFHNITQLKVTY